MSKYSRSSNKVKDTYCFIALLVVAQAFHDIECYFNHIGTKDELRGGYLALSWIRKMEGNYRYFAGASNLELGRFHQICLWKINEIKRKAIERKKNAGHGMAEKDRQVKNSGDPYIEMVPEEYRSEFFLAH